MSNVDPTVPVQGNPTTQSVRDNFSTIKTELEAFQSTATTSDGAALVSYKHQTAGSFSTGATGTTVQFALDKQWLNVLVFDATIDTTGATNDTTKIQAAIDHLESVGGGILYFPRGTYKFAGLTCTKIISFIGEGSAVTFFQNATDAATMLTCTYSGVSDKDKRNILQVNDIQWLDTASETGTGITTTDVWFVQFNRCYWRNFAGGAGAEVDESLWVEFNFCNADRSEIRCESTPFPHFNNVIRFQSGEYRNHETYAIRIVQGDLVMFDGVTIEGDSSNTTSPTRALSLESVEEVRIDGMYIEFVRTSDAGIKATSCTNVSIKNSLLGTGADTVPAIWLNDCHNVDIEGCDSTTYPFKTDGGCTNVNVRRCRWEGRISVADGDDVVFREMKPSAPCIIPINPAFQSVMKMREAEVGISLKNAYTSSSFKTVDPSGSITGAASASYETADGFLDTYSLQIDFTGAQQAVFPAMGTTDGANHGAIITFMAKADIATDFTFTGSISASVGGDKVNLTTGWRRYFLFTNLSTAGSGANIGLIIDSTETSTIYIDDIQTISYASLDDAAKYFANFRHVQTFGSAKSAATLDQTRQNFIRADVDDLVTIATGVVYASSSSLVVDTESAAASDDLDTINGVPEGCIVFVRAASSARTVVLKDGTGNLSLSGDITLDNATDVACLIKLGTFLREFSQANNGA